MSRAHMSTSLHKTEGIHNYIGNSDSLYNKAERFCDIIFYKLHIIALEIADDLLYNVSEQKILFSPKT